MKPVWQKRLGPDSDCLRACIASLLELDIDEVPDFGQMPRDKWWQEMQDWFAKFRLFWLEVRLTAHTPWFPVPNRVWCVLLGRTVRGTTHAVVGVCEGLELLQAHNPARHPTTLASVDAVCFLVPLDPRDMMPITFKNNLQGNNPPTDKAPAGHNGPQGCAKADCQINGDDPAATKS